ncbi:MAG TPA: DUF2568 domain-containing protein [Microbacteriaceae bacterium]|nr:DUF2568 domain-containing protein [Microbacteriaceae bacterium]
MDSPRAASPAGIITIAGLALDLFAFASLAAWGLATKTAPWNLVAGIAAPAAAVLVWALFLSPRAVIRVDPFGRAVAEIAVTAAAALAWWSLGNPAVALVFAAAAVAVGVMRGRRELA